MTGKGIRNLVILLGIPLALIGSIYLLLKFTSDSDNQPNASGDILLTTAPSTPSSPNDRNSVQATADAENRYVGIGKDMAGIGHDPKHYVKAICLGPSGKVWAGTEGAGVAAFDPSEHTWKWFTSADGLGDDFVYAIAADHQGRVWAGHLNHGVSVFNGQSWKNYDARKGPIGNHVFAISVCPVDGDVWIATENGLSRYSPASDEWSQFTTLEGLPSNQVQALTFDSTGNLYLGLPCDGIDILSRASGYRENRHIAGPSQFPLAPLGDGLPGAMVSDIAFASDGTLFVATPNGLGISHDKGSTWKYVCGKDWLATAEGLENHPTTLPSGAEAPLAEDRCTALAAGAGGNMYVAHLHKGVDVYQGDGSISHLEAITGTGKATIGIDALCPIPGDDKLLVATEGGGLRAVNHELIASPAVSPTLTDTAAFPLEAKALTAEQLDTLIAQLNALPLATEPAEYLGQDWDTQGDWVGHLGNDFSTLFTVFTRNQGTPGYFIRESSGTHRVQGQAGRIFFSQIVKAGTERRLLCDPANKGRLVYEINDGSWQVKDYPETWEGPDLWIDVTVPTGVIRVSLCFVNGDGHIGKIAFRDHLIQLRQRADSIADTMNRPVLAQCRVRDHFGGVYQQFIVHGPGEYSFRIVRNGAYSTALNGIFIDNLKSTPSPAGNGMPDLHPNPINNVPANNTLLVAKARRLWDTLDASYNNQGGPSFNRPGRILAYRAAQTGGADESLLANWRWKMNLWTQADSDAFDAALPVAATSPAK